MAGIGMQLGRVIERAEFEEHLLTTAEDVQRRIAQDLHDDVGQELTGLGLKAETLVEMLAAGKIRRESSPPMLRPPWTARGARSAGSRGDCCRSNWKRVCWPARWSGLP